MNIFSHLKEGELKFCYKDFSPRKFGFVARILIKLMIPKLCLFKTEISIFVFYMWITFDPDDISKIFPQNRILGFENSTRQNFKAIHLILMSSIFWHIHYRTVLVGQGYKVNRLSNTFRELLNIPSNVWLFSLSVLLNSYK